MTPRPHPGPARESSAPLALGVRGGLLAHRYRLETEAGAGGMGVVFRATDLRHNGPVAVKMLTDVVPSEEARFQREIEVLAQLAHPGIVRYLDHGRTDDGALFLVMEWLEGEDLRHRLTRGPLPPRAAVAMALRAAEALGHAHERGVVHRDIKPSNVFLANCDPSAARLVDFGVARSMRSGQSLTAVGGIVGTPAFMAPELARGQRPDARADVYSLGCTLFQCLTGRPVFSGDHALAVLLQVVLERPPRLRDLCPDVPAQLDELLAAVLSKEPENRPADGRALADALRMLVHVDRWSDLRPASRLPGQGSAPPEPPADPKPEPRQEPGEEDAPTLGPAREPWFGREAELAQALRLHRECTATQSARLLLLTGVQGIGKSRLCHELLLELAERRTPGTVWRAMGEPLNAATPFALLRQMLREAAGWCEDDAPPLRLERLRSLLARDVAPARLDEVLGYLAELAGIPPTAEMAARLDAARGDPAEWTDRIHRAALHWLECVSQRPLVLLLDNLQWADQPSIDLVVRAMRQLADRPFFVMGCGLPDLERLFPALVGLPRVDWLHLEQLPDVACEQIVHTRAPRLTPAQVRETIRVAAGNPFFVEELLRLPPGSQPATPMLAVQQRLRSMEPVARRILRAASVLGDTFWPSAVRAIVPDLEPERLEEWLQRLILRDCIVRRPTSRYRDEPEYAFSHALIRKAVYALVANADRRFAHRHAVGWLQQRASDDPLVVARHWDLGGVPEEAAQWYLRAARRALAATDCAGSLALAQRGLACEPTANVAEALRDLTRRAQRARNQGRVSGVHVAVRVAEPSAQAGNRHATVFAQAHARQDQAAAMAQEIESCARLGQNDRIPSLLAQWEPGASPESDVAATAWIQRAKWFRARHVDADPWASLTSVQTARACFQQVHDTTRALRCAVDTAAALLDLGDTDAATDLLIQTLALAQAAGHKETVGLAQLYLTPCYWRKGALGQAMSHASAALAAMLATGDRYFVALAHVHQARVANLAGLVGQAEAAAQQAAQRTDRPGPCAYGLATLAQTRLLQGSVTEAVTLAAEARRLQDQLGCSGDGDAYVRLMEVATLRAAGRTVQAETALAASRTVLLARASLIPDADLCARFVSHVPEHHLLLPARAEDATSTARPMPPARPWLDEDAA